MQQEPFELSIKFLVKKVLQFSLWCLCASDPSFVYFSYAMRMQCNGTRQLFKWDLSCQVTCRK